MSVLVPPILFLSSNVSVLGWLICLINSRWRQTEVKFSVVIKWQQWMAGDNYQVWEERRLFGLLWVTFKLIQTVLHLQRQRVVVTSHDLQHLITTSTHTHGVQTLNTSSPHQHTHTVFKHSTPHHHINTHTVFKHSTPHHHINTHTHSVQTLNWLLWPWHCVMFLISNSSKHNRLQCKNNRVYFDEFLIWNVHLQNVYLLICDLTVWQSWCQLGFIHRGRSHGGEGMAQCGQKRTGRGCFSECWRL